MSLPLPGVLFVTIGSTSLIEEQRPQPREHRVERSRRPRRETRAPSLSAAAAAAANASGVHLSTNLRAVRLLYGPVFSQNSFV